MIVQNDKCMYYLRETSLFEIYCIYFSGSGLHDRREPSRCPHWPLAQLSVSEGFDHTVQLRASRHGKKWVFLYVCVCVCVFFFFRKMISFCFSNYCFVSEEVYDNFFKEISGHIVRNLSSFEQTFQVPNWILV